MESSKSLTVTCSYIESRNMFEWTLQKNQDASTAYFDAWLHENYSKYEGYTDSSAWAYIKLFSDLEFTPSEKVVIQNFYATMTADETDDDKKCAIYSYIAETQANQDPYHPPMEVDYKRQLSQRLHPVITDVYKGEVREITYYESVVVDPVTGVQTGVTPVVKENYVYTRNADLIAQTRDLTIVWFKNDGTEHQDQKVRNKVYTNEQAIAEGVRRRTNIIDFMQIPLLGMMMQTIPCTYAEAVDQGGLFFEQYVVEVETYKFSPRQNTLQNAITDDTTYAWLNNVIAVGPVTIRDYMIDQLDY